MKYINNSLHACDFILQFFSAAIPTKVEDLKVEIGKTSAEISWNFSPDLPRDSFRVVLTPSDGDASRIDVPGDQSSVRVGNLVQGESYDVTVTTVVNEAKSEPATTSFDLGLFFILDFSYGCS